MNSLKHQLEETQAASRQRSAPERTAMFESATEQLRLSGIEAKALQVGSQMPEVSLSDAMGEQVSLRELNARGPLVIVFYRSGWCPYCSLALREWRRLLPELVRCGGLLVGISPQSPDQTLSTAEKNELAFTVLSDTGLVAARSFGIAFTLANDVVELYSQLGVDLPSSNANGRWELPIPATFVIDRNGRVAFTHVEVGYRQRAETSEVLAVVEELQKAAS